MYAIRTTRRSELKSEPLCRKHVLRASMSVPCLIGLAALSLEVHPAAAQDATLGERFSAMPKEMSEQLEQRFADIKGSPQGARDAERETVTRVPPHEAGNSELLRLNAISESVAASARCARGYVVDRRHWVSAADAAVVSEELIDCDVGGCRAFQVVVNRLDPAPFDLDISVTCSQ